MTFLVTRGRTSSCVKHALPKCSTLSDYDATSLATQCLVYKNSDTSILLLSLFELRTIEQFTARHYGIPPSTRTAFPLAQSCMESSPALQPEIAR